MAVYVDRVRPCMRTETWDYPESCHMWADSTKELVEFAKKIGLKESWLQKTKLPHFDLTANKSRLALKMGAIRANDKELVVAMKKMSCKNS